MRLIRAEQLRAEDPHASGAAGPAMRWLAGPAQADVLDVGVATLAPGAATPTHAHAGGQVIVVLEGRGWVETSGERVWIASGDVVIAAPHEMHTHGSADDTPLTHLTITTGPHHLPQP